MRTSRLGIIAAVVFIALLVTFISKSSQASDPAASANCSQPITVDNTSDPNHTFVTVLARCAATASFSKFVSVQLAGAEIARIDASALVDVGTDVNVTIKLPANARVCVGDPENPNAAQCTPGLP